jgi:hypothetical protein
VHSSSAPIGTSPLSPLSTRPLKVNTPFASRETPDTRLRNDGSLANDGSAPGRMGRRRIPGGDALGEFCAARFLRRSARALACSAFRRIALASSVRSSA